VCHDHGRKGKRGGFKFDEGLSYHCFNCDHIAVFQYNQRQPLSDDFIVLMDSFGIPADEYKQLEFKILENNTRTESLVVNTEKRLDIEPTVLEMPEFFIPLNDVPDDNVWKQLACEYLKTERGVDHTVYPFHISLDESKFNEKWLGRLIIPVYNRRNELIFYQGRSMIDHQKKYLSPTDDKTKVMYGYDQIYNSSNDMPLYVVEGFFDALMVNGCATYGNKLSPEMIEHLKRSKRRKVIVPDMYGDGDKMARQALKQGWELSIPEIPGCKDLNEAVLKYGKLYVIKALIEGTCSGFLAETRLNLFVQ
jgi:hypothetical protein